MLICSHNETDNSARPHVDCAENCYPPHSLENATQPIRKAARRRPDDGASPRHLTLSVTTHMVVSFAEAVLNHILKNCFAENARLLRFNFWVVRSLLCPHVGHLSTYGRDVPVSTTSPVRSQSSKLGQAPCFLAISLRGTLRKQVERSVLLSFVGGS
jgi:hypothetical protein